MTQPTLFADSDEAKPRAQKPLARKAYTSIQHLPGSHVTVGDKVIEHGQARILTKQCRAGDTIHVQEKLDGSCVAVAKISGTIVPLIRAGYRACDSHHEQHHLFDQWAWANESRFRSLLGEGERVVGEWLALAHGTIYELGDREPFVAFDLMRDDRRASWEDFRWRVDHLFQVPVTLSAPHAIAVEKALAAIGPRGFFGATAAPEGVVYRCENEAGEVEFLAKYVRPGFVPGGYLATVTGREPVWNWRPK